MLIPWKESYDQKQRHYFDQKDPSSQGYGFSSSHVWMWELDCEKSWAPKNWCFWTVVLEKTLESPLDCKEIQPVHSEGDQPGCSLEGLMLKLKLQNLGHLMQRTDSFEKTLMLGKMEGGRRRGRQRMRWLDGITSRGHESVWTLGVGDGQGGLACCDSWGHKESDTTEWLNWIERLSMLSLFFTVHKEFTNQWDSIWSLGQNYVLIFMPPSFASTTKDRNKFPKHFQLCGFTGLENQGTQSSLKIFS